MNIGLKNQIKTNLFFIINDVLLDAGSYENIEVNEEDFQANSLAQLFPIPKDDEFPSGNDSEARVWQSPLKNWVYESGSQQPSGMVSPIIASGVFVNGVFFNRTDAPNQHFIDYSTGRIVFDTAIDKNEDIRAEFSYKIVRVKFPDKEDEIFTGRVFVQNPDIQSTFITASGFLQELPMVLIDYDETDFAGLQLGGGRIAMPRVIFHVIANDDYTKDDIMDIIATKDRSVFNLIDWSKLEQPIGFNGDFISGGSPFSLKLLQADNSIFFNKLYFNEMKERNVPTQFEIEKGLVDTEMEIRQRSF